MNNLIFEKNDDMFKSVIFHERELLIKLYNISLKGFVTKEEINQISSTITSYFQEFHTRSFLPGRSTDSISRILRILLRFPVSHNIDSSLIENVYRSLNLINKVTYHLYQFTNKSVNSTLIGNFMLHIKGSSIDTLCTFYLYRLNPEYIKEHYFISSVDNLTPEELYYGISTGYFSMKSGTNDAVKKLFELSESNDIKDSALAKKFILKLKRDGFYFY